MRTLFFATLVFTSAWASTPLPPLHLSVGQTYPLDGLAPRSFTITPPDVARGEDSPEGLKLHALKAGKAHLEARTDKETYEIPLIVSAPDEGSRPAQGALQPPPELKQWKSLRVVKTGDKWTLEGEIPNRRAYQAALRFMCQAPDLVEIRAVLAPGIKASLMEQSLSTLRSQNLTGVEIAAAGHKFFLYGSVAHPIEVEQAFESVRPLLPTVENRLPIPLRLEPTVTVRVSMLELSRRAHRELGLSWPTGAASFARLGAGGLSWGANWDATLKHLSTHGLARVLAEPMVAVKLGSTAELSAGGEIPIRLTEHFENRLVWKHYGLRLKIQVLGIAGRSIRTKLETESSQLDSATGAGGTPGLRTNRLNTEIDAVEGEAVLLTGLFQASNSKDVEKMPILGDIPILGELFKSRNFRNEESELLIALMPSLQAVRTQLPLQGTGRIDADTSWSWKD